MNVDYSICAKAGSLAKDRWLIGAHVAQTVPSIVILVLAAKLLAKGRLYQSPIHCNLKIIFTNIIILYCLYSAPLIPLYAWYQLIHFRNYTGPCELLVSPWLSVVSRGAIMLYVTACPLWHLATTIERTRATLQAHSYEKVSTRYGIACSLVVWLLSLGFLLTGLLLGLEDENFRRNGYYVTLTTSTNANYLLVVHYAMLALDTVTFAADCCILWWNKQKLNRVSPSESSEYSLSRSYQTSENVIVTTRLVLPLGLCNTVQFSLLMALTVWIRIERPVLTVNQYVTTFEWIWVTASIQMVISLTILLRFESGAKKKAAVARVEDPGKLYFQHFRQQIGSDNVALRVHCEILEV